MAHRMIAVIALALLSGMGVVKAEDDDDVSVVEVSATGVVSAEPDQAVVQVAVETFGKHAEEASQGNAEKMEMLIETLKKNAAIPKHMIKTESYRLNPEYQHKNGKRSEKPVGYRAHNRVKVTVVGTEKLGKVIDAAIGAGGNQVAGVHFQLSETENVYQAALGEAVEIAYLRASRIAHAAGQKLGKVLTIRSTDGYINPMRESMAMSRAYGMKAADTPIESGQIEVSANVTVRYALEGKD